MRAQEHKLDHWEQWFDRLEQTIARLALLMGDANMDRAEERNLPGDLPRGRPTPDLFLNSIRFLSMMEDF